MFGFVTKLIVNKQLSFEEGSIRLYNQNILMFPVYAMADTLKELERNKSENLLYYSFKELGIKWTKILEKQYKIKKEEIFFDAGAKIISMAGWGIVKVLDADPEKHIVKFKFENSSIAKAYGKSNHPVCHMFRGMAAGSMCVTYKDNLDAIETKCKAMGFPACEIIVKPTKNFKFSEPIIKKQLKKL